MSSSTSLNAEESQVLHDILSRYDTDKDQEISLQEILEEFAKIGDPATADVLKTLMLENWDQNQDNKLSFDEIRTMAIKWSSFSGDAGSTGSANTGTGTGTGTNA
jgi:Ca2+-binding EF-hand superfamily protein